MRETYILTASSFMQMCQTLVYKAEYGWSKTALPISMVSDMKIVDTYEGL